MPTSRTTFLAEVLSGGPLPVAGKPIPEGQLAYFRERLKGRIFSTIVRGFLDQQKEDPIITKASIARRLQRRPEQINRWLSGPSNMTLDTVSDLILAIYGGEPSVSVDLLKSEAKSSPTVSPSVSALSIDQGESTGRRMIDKLGVDVSARFQSDVVDFLSFQDYPPEPYLAALYFGVPGPWSSTQSPYFGNQVSGSMTASGTVLIGTPLMSSYIGLSTFVGGVHEAPDYTAFQLRQTRRELAITKQALRRSEEEIGRLRQTLAAAPDVKSSQTQGHALTIDAIKGGNDNTASWSSQNNGAKAIGAGW